MLKIVGRADSEAAATASLYDEHDAALWRYALGLTGDTSRHDEAVRETLLRACPPSRNRPRRRTIGPSVALHYCAKPDHRPAAQRTVRSSCRFVRRLKHAAAVRSPRHRRCAGPAADRRRDRPTVGRIPGRDRALQLRGMDYRATGLASESAKKQWSPRLHHAARGLRLTPQEIGLPC